MALTSIPWSTGSWLNDPLSHETDAEGNLVVVVGAKKDFWKKTMFQVRGRARPSRAVGHEHIRRGGLLQT